MSAHPFDVCFCGDYRHQHVGGTGRCLLGDLCTPLPPCQEFRFASGPSDEDLKKPDPDRELLADQIYDALCTAFGARTVHGWPMIPHAPSRWWQWRIRRTERRINGALASLGFGPLTSDMCLAYWHQIRKGQEYREDAGGYFWRCWCAALGLPYLEPEYTYSGHCAPHDIPVALSALSHKAS